MLPWGLVRAADVAALARSISATGSLAHAIFRAELGRRTILVEVAAAHLVRARPVARLLALGFEPFLHHALLFSGFGDW
jgi:hypothetical protein